MKHSIFSTGAIAFALVAMSVPAAAPADPIAAPAATKRLTTPVAPRADQPMSRATQPIAKIGVPSTGSRFVPTQAPTEFCVMDTAFFDGSSNNGTTFCSRLTGFQVLPVERQGKISAATIPAGYSLVLFERVDRSGKSCRLTGDNAGLDASCDNMARAVSLETETQATLTQVQNEREVRQRASAAGDPGFAHQIERDRAAAARRQAEIAAEEREARSRMAQEDRRDAAARDADAARERQRVAVVQAEEAKRRLVLDQLVSAASGCLVTVYRSDNKLFQAFPEHTCFNDSTPYVGNSWNNDIEWIQFDFVQPSRVVVTLYEEDNFQGRSLRLVCGNYELIDDVENEVSSIKIEIMPTPQTCFNRGLYTAKYDWDR